MDEILYFYKGSLYKKFDILISENEKGCIWKIFAYEINKNGTGPDEKVRIAEATEATTWDIAYKNAKDFLIKIKNSRRFTEIK